MRKNQIKFLFKRADELIDSIQDRYRLAVESKNVNDDFLKIEILFTLVCFRVILDYLAQDVADICKVPDINKRQIYFPITTNKTDFEKFPLVKNLKKLNSAMYSYLYDMQPFPEHGEIRGWLGQMNDLINHNKHDSLSPHSVSENNGISVAGIVARSINVGSGGRIIDKSGRDLVAGPVCITPDSLIGLQRDGKISATFQKVSWTSIHFDGIENSVIDVLRQARQKTEAIQKDIYKLLHISE